MRRAATAVFAITALAVSFGAPSIASAETPVPEECALVATSPGASDPFCTLLEPLAPTQPVTDEATTPAAPTAPAPAAPAPAPESETGSDTATAPSSSGAPATAASSTSPAPASLGGGLAAPSSSASTGRGSSSRVPEVPVGSTLELGPLALPRFSGPATTPAASASASDAVAERIVLPAARAASSLPTQSRTMAVAVALGTLLLAAGLLVDQARRARQPFPV